MSSETTTPSEAADIEIHPIASEGAEPPSDAGPLPAAAAEMSPWDERVAPIGLAADDIIKSFALFGGSGFMFQAAYGLNAWLSDTLGKYIAAFCSLVLATTAVFLVTIGMALLSVGITRLEKHLFPSLSKRQQDIWSLVVAGVVAFSMTAVAAHLIHELT